MEASVKRIIIRIKSLAGAPQSQGLRPLGFPNRFFDEEFTESCRMLIRSGWYKCTLSGFLYVSKKKSHSVKTKQFHRTAKVLSICLDWSIGNISITAVKAYQNTPQIVHDRQWIVQNSGGGLARNFSSAMSVLIESLDILKGFASQRWNPRIQRLIP